MTWDEMYAAKQQGPFAIIGSGKGPGPKGGKHYIEPRGYAAIPGTGPSGETCGSCQHIIRKRLGNAYRKCALMRSMWTGGAKTDIKAKSPACSRWEPK